MPDMPRRRSGSRSDRPEVSNGEIVVFHALDQKDIAAIAGIQLQRPEQRLAQQDMKLDVTTGAIREIAKAGFDPVYGARPLKCAIRQRVENRVLGGLASLHFDALVAALNSNEPPCAGFKRRR